MQRRPVPVCPARNSLCLARGPFRAPGCKGRAKPRFPGSAARPQHGFQCRASGPMPGQGSEQRRFLRFQRRALRVFPQGHGIHLAFDGFATSYARPQFSVSASISFFSYCRYTRYRWDAIFSVLAMEETLVSSTVEPSTHWMPKDLAPK